MKKLALLLTPGAGSSRDHSSLLAVEAAAPKQATVARHDFPYRRAGRRAPDRAPVLLDDLAQAVDSVLAAAKVKPDRVVLGGRSMGGRICSMLVAGDDDRPARPAAGLVLISYPLHPPGKPEKPRTEHLPRLHVPCLFISGTLDAFGTPEELEAATAAIPGAVTHVWVDGGRHDLKGADDLIARAVWSWVRSGPLG